jgi:CHAT domain-containing protein
VHEFYQAWRGGTSAADALRTAQARVRQQFPDARDWASFVVTSVGRQ